MDQDELIDIFEEGSKRMSANPGRCGNLLYTQTHAGRGKIREPEGRHILTQILREKGVNYGIEVPTRKRYYMSNPNVSDTAAIDFAIFMNDGTQTNVELKEGHVKYTHIRKDIMKFLGEEVDGCAMFHILQNTNRETIPKLIVKYNQSLTDLREMDIERYPKWFVLFLYVVKKREWFIYKYDNIMDLFNEEIA